MSYVSFSQNQKYPGREMVSGKVLGNLDADSGASGDMENTWKNDGLGGTV